jgi:hypothetical protein
MTFKRVFIVYRGPFKCPNCGSWNTGQAIKVDWCYDCGYEDVYP